MNKMMTKKLTYLTVLFAMLFAFASCKEDKKADMPEPHNANEMLSALTKYHWQSMYINPFSDSEDLNSDVAETPDFPHFMFFNLNFQKGSTGTIDIYWHRINPERQAISDKTFCFAKFPFDYKIDGDKIVLYSNLDFDMDTNANDMSLEDMLDFDEDGFQYAPKPIEIFPLKESGEKELFATLTYNTKLKCFELYDDTDPESGEAELLTRFYRK